MLSAAEQLRTAIEAFHHHWGDAELSWLRRGEVEAPWRASAEILLSRRSAELLGEAQSEHVLDATAYAAVQEQRAWIAFRVCIAQARPTLAGMLSTRYACGSEGVLPLPLLAAILRAGQGEGSLMRARTLALSTESFAHRACELRDEAQAAVQAIVAAPEHVPGTLAEAEKLLDATEDAARDSVRWLLKHAVTNGDTRWNTLLFALRRRELDGLAPTARRFHRLSAGFRKLGFEREMNAHLHVEPAVPVVFPFLPRVTMRAVPDDIRLAIAGSELGVLSDLQGAAALGGGLALALVSPALPVEQRFACGQGVPEALGQLSLQLRADARYLQRIEALPPREAEIVARHAGLILLLTTRACAALELAAHTPSRHLDERGEALGNALSRALCVDVPAGFAALAWLSLPPFAADLRGKLAGLAMHVGLRERFDDDWYRNPRAAEPLRGACARGNTLDASALCAELGCALSAAAPRLLELLA